MAPVCTCGTGKQKHWSRRWTWEQEPFPWKSDSCTTPMRLKALWDVHWAAQLWGSLKTRLVSRVKDENVNQYFWEIITLCFSLSKHAQGRIIESIGGLRSLPPHPQVEECRYLVGGGGGGVGNRRRVQCCNGTVWLSFFYVTLKVFRFFICLGNIMSAPTFDENCDCIKKNFNQGGLRLQFYQEG